MLVSVCSQMVILDVFKHSGIIPSSGCLNNLSVAQRVSYVFRRALSGVVAATVCSLCCFLPGLFSHFDVLRNFSMEMCYILCINLVLQFTFTPSCILVHHYYFSHRRRNLQHQKEMFIENTVRGRPIAQVELHGKINKLFVENGLPCYKDMLDDAKKRQDDEVNNRVVDKSLTWWLNLKQYFSKIRRQSNGSRVMRPCDDVELNNVDRDNPQIDIHNCNVYIQDLSTVVRIQAFNSEKIHIQDGAALTKMVKTLGDITTLPQFRLNVLAQRMGITSHCSDATPHIHHVARLLAYHIESHGWAIDIEAPDEVKRMKRDARPPSLPLGGKMSFKERFLNFIKRRRIRKYHCCGPLNETPEERKKRISELSVKLEGYNRMERFLAGPFARVTRRGRYGVISFLVSLLIFSIAMSSTLSTRSTLENLLPPRSAADAFQVALRRFPYKGNCDYCAPYFTERHPINTTALETCYKELGYYSLDMKVNACGNCNSLDCLPCDHDTSGAVMDSCGNCLQESDPRRDSCKYNSLCNNRGILNNTSLSNSNLADQCICNGQSFGPSCEFCRCYNGGSCDSNGKCHCIGGWSGVDCSSCGKCGKGAFCPVQWSHSHYSYFTCRELFCTVTEFMEGSTVPGTSCAKCEDNRVTSNCNHSTRKCVTDSFSTTYPRNTCKCRGNFVGPKCDICNTNGNPKLTCDRYGTLVGCDGRPEYGGKYAVTDRCGVCNGRNECERCDDESDSDLDACGKCGGDNDCGHSVGDVFIVDVLWKVPPAVSLITLKRLIEFCKDTPSDIILPIVAQCYLDIPVLRSALENATSENTHTARTNYIKFLFEYSRMNAMTDRVIFTSADPNDPTFDLEYIVGSFKSKIDDMSQMHLIQESRKRWVSWLSQSPFQSTHLSSSAWIALGVHEAIKWDCISIVIVGFTASMLVVAVYSCSLRIVLAAAIVLSLNVLWAFAVTRMFSTEFGVDSIVAVLFVYCISLSGVMFMSEGYVEQLHSTQSHLLAMNSTRKENVKGMLRRTGVPVGLSTIIVFLSSLLLLGAKTPLFKRIGGFMAINSVFIGVTCLFGLSSLLVSFGPARTHRTIIVMLCVGAIGSGIFITVVSLTIIPGSSLFYA